MRRSSGTPWPDQRVTINLAPSNLPKTGSHFDLAIATAGSVAKRVVGRMTPASQARRVQLIHEIAPSLPTCETDVSRVEQILVNLLANAVQHTPEGSVVRLELSAREGFVVFTVRDQGPGVPPTELEHVFDIYATRKEGNLRGVGLGLPLSRRLARLLGGDLLAVATGGQGGEFRLELPASP